MSNHTLLVRLENAIEDVERDQVEFADLHRAWKATVEAIEGLSWPMLKRGRDLAYSLQEESFWDTDEFDRKTCRSALLRDLANWIQSVKQAGK